MAKLLGIEEMAKIVADRALDAVTYRGLTLRELVERVTNGTLAEVVHAKWEWFEEWNPSTPDHPRECDNCGWICGHCKTSLADMVGGYWDNYYETPKVNYCPDCGAKMDLEG